MNRNILSYSAKWFVIVALVAVLLWAFVFDNITKPTDTETISLFLTAEASDSPKIKEKIAMDGITTNVITAAETDTYYSVQFTTTALMTCDLIVMNVEQMPETHADLQFAPLDADLSSKYSLDVTKLTFVQSEGTAYGIVVFDKEHDINLLDGLARFDESKVYCVAVNSTRPNAAPFSKAKQTTDNAFVALSKLLSAN